MPSSAVALLAVCAPLLGQPSVSFYQARLLTPITSYAKAGTAFQARVLGPLSQDRPEALPPGTIIHGRIRSTRPVRFGIKRERALLEVQFVRCEAPGAEDLPCEVSLASIDNAREKVVKPNHIQGILAASHPHSLVGGLWFRPVPGLFSKSPAGLTGLAGMIQARLPHPALAVAIVGSRLAFFRMPEPEIQLAPGVDLIVRAASLSPAAPPIAAQAAPAPLSEDLLGELERLSAAVSLPDKTLAADIVNFAFLGSRAELTESFAAAGWSTTEPLNAKTFARTYQAFSAMTTYPNAPVSSLYYDGRPAGVVFQKSLNTLAKRHHIRLWPVELAGQEFWLGAATHDIGVGFDWSRMSITHRIDPYLDRERSIIFNDLTEAGCVAWSGHVGRSGLERRAADRGPIITDGSLLVVGVQPCTARQDPPSPLPKYRRSLAVRAVRRVVLETRHYITRGNPYYWAYRTGRWGADQWGVRAEDE